MAHKTEGFPSRRSVIKDWFPWPIVGHSTPKRQVEAGYPLLRTRALRRSFPPRSFSYEQVLPAVWAVVDQALFALSNFTMSMLLARWLTPQDYGAFGVVFAVFLFLGVVHSAYFTEPMLVFGTGKYRQHLNTYVRILLRAHLRFSLVAVLFIGGAVGVFIQREALLFHSMVGLAVMTPLALLLWLTRKACYVFSTPRLAASAGAIYMFLMLFALSLLYSRGWLSGEMALITMGLSSLAASSWLVYRLLSASSTTSGLSTPAVAQSHRDYGRWAIRASVLSWLVGNGVFLALPVWGSLDAVGALKALVTLVLPVLHVITALSTFLVPVLVRAGTSDEFLRVVKLAIVLLIAAAFMYGTPLAIFARPVVHWLYAGKYDAVAHWLPPLVILPPLSAVTAVLASALRALNRPNLVFRASAISAVGVVALALPLLRYWEVGGAVTLLLTGSAISAIALWSMRRNLEPIVSQTAATE